MKKTILAAALVLAAAFSFMNVRAATDLTATGNNFNDADCVTWGLTKTASICGSATGTYLRLSGGSSNALSVSNAKVGVNNTAPASSLDVVGNTLMTPASVSQVPLVTNGLSGQTGDLADFKLNSSTVTVIGPNGHVAFPVYRKVQYDTLVPDYPGVTTVCVDCNFTYNLCVSSGSSAAMWYAVKTSTGGVGSGGVIGGTKQLGCGTNQ